MRLDAGGGEVMACLCRADADAVVPGVLRGSVGGGREEGRGGWEEPLALDWISPAAVESVLVNEEIAQPVQEAASLGWGVLIRGAEPADASAMVGAGMTVSGIVEANLRIRWT